MKQHILNLVLAFALLASSLYVPVTLAQAPSLANVAPVSFSHSSDNSAGRAEYSRRAMLLRRGAFDPLLGEPAIPPEMSRTRTGQTGLRLVQFPGPIQDAWYAAMLSAGLEVVSYIPDGGYLVWGQDAAEARLRSSVPVRWAGIYLTPFMLCIPT